MSDDDSLFKKMMQNVKPLKKGGNRHHEHRSKPAIKVSSAFEEPEVPLPALSDFVANPVDAETLISGGDTRLFHRIKWNIDATIDLHGLNADEARGRLLRFIKQHQQQNQKQLLIIHGKGSRHHEPPVLKNLVHCWLGQIDAILAWKSAPAQHGGAGALWLILRRI